MIGMDLVGFLDDDPHKRAMRIQGVPVLGALEDSAHDRAGLPRAAGDHRNADGAGEDHIAGSWSCARRRKSLRASIPGLADILDGGVSVSQLRKVEIEDLLRREPVLTDTGAVTEMLRGKHVLVTGGGGSIGERALPAGAAVPIRPN